MCPCLFPESLKFASGGSIAPSVCTGLCGLLRASPVWTAAMRPPFGHVVISSDVAFVRNAQS